MKPQAIITTLLDRQAILLQTLLERKKIELITPRLFASITERIAKCHGVRTHIIEEQYQATDEKEVVLDSIKNINNSLQQHSSSLKNWLKENKFSPTLSTALIKSAKSRTEKIIKTYANLEKLNSSLDIRALVLNQEYMIHEATLIQWAKERGIPIIHFCHSPYIARNLGSIRHFESDHITLASHRCNEVLDDLGTGKGNRYVTGMVNWDTYRSIGFQDIKEFSETLKIPEDALIISFFTTYAVHENATSDPETYEKTIDAFLSACSYAKDGCSQPLFFIIKDRPTGNQFSYEQVMNKAKKYGIEKNFAYIFDRPERVLLISDITISPGSSISVESMAMGKATIELVARQVFLGGLCFSANDGVIQATPSTLPNDLLHLCMNEKYRENLADKVFENSPYVEATQAFDATRQATALLLEVIGEPALAIQTLEDEDFYEKLDITGTDHRFHQVNAFQIWRSRTQPNELTGQLMGERYNQWKSHPTFHLVIIADKSLFSALANTLDSFELQIYPHYGISIISPDPCPSKDLIDSQRLQWIESKAPFEDVNRVIKAVDADWVMQVWPGDELQPQALFNLADYSNINSDWLVLYGDEVIIKPSDESLDDDQSRLGSSLHTDPVFKPDFNLDLLRSTDYVNRATAFRKDAWLAMDGFRSFAYRQTEDMVFRIAERMTLPAIGHLPFVLIHRSEFMSNLVISEEHESLGALIRQEHLHRCGFTSSQVLPGLHPQIFNTRYHQNVGTETIDLLLTTSGLTDHLSACLASIQEHNSEQKLNIYIATQTSKDKAQNWLIDKGLKSDSISWVEVKQADFSFTGQLQQLTSTSKSAYFVIATDRLRWVQKNWLTPLLDQLQRPDVAMVGPRLVSSRASIISAGQILGKDGLIGDLYQDFFLEQEIPGLPRAWCEQNFNALNPACLAVKRSTYISQDGLDTKFSSSLAINDLQLRLCTQGHKLVWTPLSSIVLTEKSPQAPVSDRTEFKRRWFNLLLSDPAFNYNLQLRDSGIYPDILLSGTWHPAHFQRPRLLFAALDLHAGQKEALKPIAEALRSAIKDESLQLQDYIYSSMQQQQPVTAVEISRLHPDAILYFGTPKNHRNTISELATFSQIKQWVLITNEEEWSEWAEVAESLYGVLLTNHKLAPKIELSENQALHFTRDVLDVTSLERWLSKISEKKS